MLSPKAVKRPRWLPRSPRRAARTTLRQTFCRLVILIVLGVFTWSWFSAPTPDPNYGVIPSLSTASDLEGGGGSLPRVAFATFLSGDEIIAEKNDDYFRAARLMTYQLLHSEETRSSRHIPFIVLVTKSIPGWKREQLTRDGATVVEAEDVPLTWWIRSGVKRWKDQFTKLRLLQMTEYERICFIDADTLIMGPLDGIFDEPDIRSPPQTMLNERSHQIRWDEALLPANYVFAARSDNDLLGRRSHTYPPGHTDHFTAGFWVAAPSHELYAYLMSVMSHWRRFDPHTMEQSLLNYAFRRKGTMPWTELDAKWSSTWPNQGDIEAGVKSLHEKFWKRGPKNLKKLYMQRRKEGEEFFEIREQEASERLSR